MTELDAKMMLSRVMLGTSRCRLVRGGLSEQQGGLSPGGWRVCICLASQTDPVVWGERRGSLRLEEMVQKTPNLS